MARGTFGKNPKVSCSFTQQQLAAVNDITYRKNISFAKAVRLIVDDYLKRMPK